MEIVISPDGGEAGEIIIPPPDIAPPVIRNTDFFPDVDPAVVSERIRLGYEVTPVRLNAAIKSAMAEVNAELSEYKAEQMAAGFDRLADVPAECIDGESIKCFYYQSAVCAMTTAAIFEGYRSYDSSGKGDTKADRLEASIDDQWRDMGWFLSRLKGQSRCLIEQI